MGMFDTIKDTLFCPFCGKLVDGFQTKDLSDTLADWTIKEIKESKTRKRDDDTRIYSECNNCKEWVELVIIGEGKFANQEKVA